MFEIVAERICEMMVILLIGVAVYRLGIIDETASKRLSDLLCDARVPAADRAGVPVVRTAPNGQVLWVAGIRADERARCQTASRLLVELTLYGNDANTQGGR